MGCRRPAGSPFRDASMEASRDDPLSSVG